MQVQRLSLRNAILILFCCLQACLSMAICPFPERRTRTQFTRSEVVFIGTILSKRGINQEGKPANDMDPFGDAEYLCYRVKAEQIFRGAKKNEYEIFEGNDSSRMGLQIGQTYLFLIEKEDNGILLGSCRDAINSRDPNYPKKIEEVKEVIRNIKANEDGEILGFVGLTEGNSSHGLEGIRFAVKGNGVRKTVVSDKDGWFHLRVPSGLYDIEPIESNYEIMVSIYSPDHPDRIDVRVAGGAEISFVAKPKN
jgi:hypothetical protein